MVRALTGNMDYTARAYTTIVTRVHKAVIEPKKRIEKYEWDGPKYAASAHKGD